MRSLLPLLPLLFSSCHHSPSPAAAPHPLPSIASPVERVPEARNDSRESLNIRIFHPMEARAELEPGRVRVPRRNTPIDIPRLMMVLHDAHQDVFGFPPTRRRLAGALAQVRAENGNGVKVYNHNLGNIGLAPRMKAAFYQYGAGIFLVFPSFADGARAYWRTVARCTSALAAFEWNDPDRAAHAFHRCGYHTTEPNQYASVLRPLYWSSHNFLKAP